MLQGVPETLAVDLLQRGKIDLSECYTRDTFIVAKKEIGVGETRAGQKNLAFSIT